MRELWWSRKSLDFRVVGSRRAHSARQQHARWDYRSFGAKGTSHARCSREHFVQIMSGLVSKYIVCTAAHLVQTFGHRAFDMPLGPELRYRNVLLYNPSAALTGRSTCHQHHTGSARSIGDEDSDSFRRACVVAVSSWELLFILPVLYYTRVVDLSTYYYSTPTVRLYR
eukprot:COSAG02_NODE_11111_length_1791_cov_1.657210_1_plen_169_part_00